MEVEQFIMYVTELNVSENILTTTEVLSHTVDLLLSSPWTAQWPNGWFWVLAGALGNCILGQNTLSSYSVVSLFIQVMGGVSTLRRAVLGETNNSSGNLEILQVIGRQENF